MLYGAMNFPVSPVLNEIEAIAGLGFDYCELTLDPPMAHHEVVKRGKRQIIETLKKNGLGLVCHLPTFVYTADLTPRLRDASIQEMKDSLGVAAELGPLKVVVHPSYIMGLGIFVLDQAKRYADECLEILVDRAERLGVQVCVENMFPQSPYLMEPEEFEELLEKFPHVNMTFDTGHANIGNAGGKRALNFVRRVGHRIGHVHASDNSGKDDGHLPIGTGTVDFPGIVKALKAAGYDDTITLEVFSRDRDYLRISREKLKALVEAA